MKRNGTEAYIQAGNIFRLDYSCWAARMVKKSYQFMTTANYEYLLYSSLLLDCGLPFRKKNCFLSTRAFWIVKLWFSSENCDFKLPKPILIIPVDFSNSITFPSVILQITLTSFSNEWWHTILDIRNQNVSANFGKSNSKQRSISIRQGLNCQLLVYFHNILIAKIRERSLFAQVIHWEKFCRLHWKNEICCYRNSYSIGDSQKVGQKNEGDRWLLVHVRVNSY